MKYDSLLLHDDFQDVQKNADGAGMVLNESFENVTDAEEEDEQVELDDADKVVASSIEEEVAADDDWKKEVASIEKIDDEVVEDHADDA